MKSNPNVSSDRSKQRKARLASDSTKRAKLMCAPLAKDLSKKWGGVKSMPIRKDDRVRVVRGKGQSENIEGKITRVFRKKFVVHVERFVKDKPNGSQVSLPVDPSNLVITQLKMDKNRKEKLEAKLKGRNDARVKKGLQPVAAQE